MYGDWKSATMQNNAEIAVKKEVLMVVEPQRVVKRYRRDLAGARHKLLGGC
jgi:hypothetical protein